MNQHIRALFALGQFEVTATVIIADMTTYFGRTGATGGFKMVVTIEGEDKLLIMEDITPDQMLAVISLQTLDESEIHWLYYQWDKVQPLLDRIPRGYEIFRPVP